ncbi:SID1 transmembrane family member 1-like [Ptychodera flava]|uniref:SID1 transmembrane family member 1-like n=1 Tax=Ptychodera flava TaxID=63121 RepID=UPI00396AAE77
MEMQMLCRRLMLLVFLSATSTANAFYELNTLYHGNVSQGQEVLYPFQVRVGMNKTEAVRVEVSSSDAQEQYPLLFVVTQQEGIMSWKLPLQIMSVHKYDTVGRTMCPMNFGDKEVSDLMVRVTCSSPNVTLYNLIVSDVNDFEMQLSTPKTVLASPSTPQYYYFKFPEDVNAVSVRGYSKDKICASISVQDATCPVHDLLSNVKYIGMVQSVTTQSSIPVQKTVFKEFFILLTIHPSDTECTELKQSSSHDDEDKLYPGYQGVRMKEMIINVIPTIPESTYVVGTIVIVLFYLSFYGIYGLLVLIQYCRRENAYDLMPETTSDGSVARNQSINDSLFHLVITNNSNAYLCHVGDGDSSNTNEGDNTEIPISVDLLSDTPNEEQTEKYKLYCLNLIPIAIFYALPVIQLVLAYQHVYHDNGDEDICYYNFLCANPLGVLSSFNNVFSNIGYVLLGILFLIITRREENMHQALSPERTNEFGLPRYFGIFYAIGIALIMEGIHSACYHVCPTHGNFQFDTSYMYIMVSLSMLKLYQGRHPDGTSSSHVSYICLALVIFVTVIGVVFETVWFWVIFTLLHMLMTFVLSVQIYYVKKTSHGESKVPFVASSFSEYKQ